MTDELQLAIIQAAKDITVAMIGSANQVYAAPNSDDRLNDKKVELTTKTFSSIYQAIVKTVNEMD